MREKEKKVRRKRNVPGKERKEEGGNKKERKRTIPVRGCGCPDGLRRRGSNIC
jgi:hypothetical protein